MGTAPSMLTLKKSNNTVIIYQEIVCLYKRFRQLDRHGKGFISADEFLSVPEFAMNPLSQEAGYNKQSCLVKILEQRGLEMEVEVPDD